MNTIHSVSNTSLVRSSEAVAVRNSFSFRTFMMRVMLVIAIVVGGKVAWACPSITFSTQGYSNGADVSSATISASSPSISVSFSSGAKYYNTGSAIRVYGGKTFTITSSSNITSITLTFGSGDGSNSITANTGSYNNGSWTGNANSVTFTIGGSSGHRRIARIEVCVGSSTYSVSYYPNGGDGTMTDNTNYASGATVTVLANTFTAPDDMDFNGWNTSADGSGSYYDAGDIFSITENTTLYAQWITSGCRSVAFSSMGLSNGTNLSGTLIRISSAITVTFNKASGGTAPAYYTSGTSIRAYAKNTFTISTSGSNITSMLFTFGSGEGSNDITASTGTYSDGMWVGSASSVTFTVGGESGHRRIASIRACTGGVILLYNANGGTGTMIDTNNPYTSGSTVTTMTNDFTAPADMEFGGWNTAADGSGDYYAEGETFTITASTTLYAQWVAPGDAGCPGITFSEQGYSEQFAEPSAIFGNADEITVAFNQGTSNNPPKYFGNGTSIRAYNGNTITVSVSGFNLITSIRLLFGNDDGNNPITANAGTYNSGVWSGSESSVTFTIGYSQGNHRRIAGIRVCTAQPTSATITYDGNGATSGSVVDSNNPYDIDATVTVLGQGNLENECNTFAGWNTSADGSGTSYQEDDTFTITENVTLYAQWTPVLDYTISWLANGQLVGNHNFGCGSNIDVAYVPEDASVTSAMCDGSKVFVGWAETEFEKTNTPSATIITYDDFGDIAVTGDQKYYAVFADESGSVNYEWTLVLDASTLAVNDSIVIVASDYLKALSTTQNDNNRSAVNITKSDDKATVSLGGTVQIIRLDAGTVDNTFGFYVGNGYLFAASSSKNYLRTQATNNDNGSWEISIADSVASIVAQGTNTRNTIQYNSSNSIFSCYASVQQDVSIYKKTKVSTYSDYTTFCPCAFYTDGIEGDNNFIWSGKNAGDDWGLTSNWVVYNSSEPEYHLAANEPASSTKVFIINITDCNIVTPTVAEDATCGNLTMNGFNINIAENQTLTINGTATFTNGVINGNVIFGSSATVSGASASSHVDGVVTKSGAANGFTFPTGSNGNLGKVVVTDGTATNVSVQYFSNPAGFGTNDLPRWWNAADMSGENPFNHVSNVEYWKISSNEAITADFVAEASTDMHFNSETDEEDRIPANIQMAFYDNNRWTNVGGLASIDGNTLSINGAEIPASAIRGISGNYTTFGSKSKSTVLPIELVFFTANCNGRSALIEWTTATEKNNDFFVLERSNDAVNFKEIARIAGAGNSIEPISYAYTDFGIRNGDNYYRLVQFDYDGTSTASEIIVANCLGTDGEPEVLAYPNPFGDDITLRFENFGNIQATVEVYDMLGRMVHTQKVNCSQNDYEVVLRLAGLSDGTYNVRISAKEFVLNRQVIKN